MPKQTTEEVREYLKRQVMTTPGITQQQRESMYTLELVYSLHRKINELQRTVSILVAKE